MEDVLNENRRADPVRCKYKYYKNGNIKKVKCRGTAKEVKQIIAMEKGKVEEKKIGEEEKGIGGEAWEIGKEAN